MGKKRNNSAQTGNAITRFTMRLLVAGYIMYMTVKIVQNSLSGASTMSSQLSLVFAAVFALLGAAFVIYSLRRLKTDLAAAKGSGEDKF